MPHLLFLYVFFDSVLLEKSLGLMSQAPVNNIVENLMHVDVFFVFKTATARVRT